MPAIFGQYLGFESIGQAVIAAGQGIVGRSRHQGIKSRFTIPATGLGTDGRCGKHQCAPHQVSDTINTASLGHELQQWPIVDLIELEICDEIHRNVEIWQIVVVCLRSGPRHAEHHLTKISAIVIYTQDISTANVGVGRQRA